jgi:hypothetical protein
MRRGSLRGCSGVSQFAGQQDRIIKRSKADINVCLMLVGQPYSHQSLEPGRTQLLGRTRRASSAAAFFATNASPECRSSRDIASGIEDVAVLNADYDDDPPYATPATRENAHSPNNQVVADIDYENSTPGVFPWRRRRRSRWFPVAPERDYEQAALRARWSEFHQSVLGAAETPRLSDVPAVGFEPHWVVIWQVMNCLQALSPNTCSSDSLENSRCYCVCLLCPRRRLVGRRACTSLTGLALARTN